MKLTPEQIEHRKAARKRTAERRRRVQEMAQAQAQLRRDTLEASRELLHDVIADEGLPLKDRFRALTLWFEVDSALQGT